MDDKTHIEMVDELNQRSLVLEESTALLNMVGEYMSDEDNSPQEDQHEAALNDHLSHLVQDHPEVVGHIIVCFASMIVQIADSGDIQQWINFQSNKIIEDAEAAGIHGHPKD